MKQGDPAASSDLLYRSQALCRALDIMDCFSQRDRELSLTDIVQRTGLNKTTAKRMLYNLVSRSYLQQNFETRRYRLGMRVFELGGIVHSSFSLRDRALPHLVKLRDKTGLTVFMGVAVEDRLVYVEKLGGTGIIQISSAVGWHTNLHFGMLGMVLMAYLPDSRVHEILEKQPLVAYTPFSITDPHAFRIRLAEIRRRGFAEEHNEAHEGLSGVAAPIYDYSRVVVAALGVSLPESRNHGPEAVREIGADVKAAAGGISHDLGYFEVQATVGPLRIF
ncbi:MAG TPA: IclR family transcriptional regulator [Syntrophobacteraceae bacterium]|nr:IclR family transcriptional regulator [Syntrophobacteraceae bacterium]